MVVVASIQMLLARRILDIAFFVIIIITAIYCPLLGYAIQKKPVVMLDSERDYKLQHWIEMLALPRQNTIMPLSGLLHRVRRFYDFYLNIGCLAIEKRVKKFSPWILLPVITKYVKPYFQLLVDKGLIWDMWTPCMNLSCYWSCLHHRLWNMHTIWCLHYVVENLEGNIQNGKICYGVIQINRFI